MIKKLLIFALILAGIIFYTFNFKLLAEEKYSTKPTVAMASKTQNVFATVGKVNYVDFKSRSNPTVVINDNKGKTVKVSLKELKNGATILATFRKKETKKGKEENVLVSLSIVRSAQEEKKSGRKR